MGCCGSKAAVKAATAMMGGTEEILHRAPLYFSKPFEQYDVGTEIVYKQWSHMDRKEIDVPGMKKTHVQEETLTINLAFLEVVKNDESAVHVKIRHVSTVYTGQHIAHKMKPTVVPMEATLVMSKQATPGVDKTVKIGQTDVNCNTVQYVYKSKSSEVRRTLYMNDECALPVKVVVESRFEGMMGLVTEYLSEYTLEQWPPQVGEVDILGMNCRVLPYRSDMKMRAGNSWVDDPNGISTMDVEVNKVVAHLSPDVPGWMAMNITGETSYESIAPCIETERSFGGQIGNVTYENVKTCKVQVGVTNKMSSGIIAIKMNLVRK